MRFDLISIFPDFFSGPLSYGVVARAARSGLIDVRTHDLRTFTSDRHQTVDDRPFGGGEGMVIKAQPILRCLEMLELRPKLDRDPARETVVLLSAQGRRFTQQMAHELATLDRMVMICGRYEGVDERVNSLCCDRELSVGDYVVSGGELPALLILDAVARLVPGVLGHPDSARNESFGAADTTPPTLPGELPSSTHGTGGLLDYPHYTRPASVAGLEVPEVLQGGNHAQIRQWRREQSLRKTWQNRPDLLAGCSLPEEDLRFLAKLRTEQT